MDNLYWLDQIQSTDLPLVGEKAFDLSKLLQRGYPVVNGFVVPAPCFREFLETINWSEPLGLDLPNSSLHLDVDNSRQLQRVAQKIRQEIMAAALPASWLSKLHSAVEAVFEREVGQERDRELSTPTTALLQCSPSIALVELGDKHNVTGIQTGPANGLYETHICPPELAALTLSLKQTWAELFRARSLFYWQRAGIGVQHLSLAILVQPIWPGVASGNLHSTGAGFSIQATWGLPHALFKGEVIPDSFRVHPETGTVQSQQLGSKTLAYGLADSGSVHLSSYELLFGNAKGRSTRYGSDEHLSPHRSSGLMVHSSWQGSNGNEQSSVLNDYLQAYLLGEEQQKQYALAEKYLQQLIEQGRRLRIELGTVFSLEWMLCLTQESSEPTLYITQITKALLRTGAGEQGSRVVGAGKDDRMSTQINFQQNPPSSGVQGSRGENRSTFSFSPHPLCPSTPHFPPLPLIPRERHVFPKGDPESPLSPEVTASPLSASAPLVRGLAAAAGLTMAKAQVISGFSKNVEAIPSGRVLVTRSVTPDWLPLLKKAAGIVAENGGMTCHAAIMARELGIPAVVGAAGATGLIQTGEYVLVDGDTGVISRVRGHSSLVTRGEALGEKSFGDTDKSLPERFAPTDSVGAKHLGNNLCTWAEISAPNASPLLDQEPMTNDTEPRTKYKQPIATQLLVNLSQPELIERAAALPVDGVGLLRSELMVLAALENQHPSWWVQQGRQRELVQTLAQHIYQFARVFWPRPIFYRSLDLRSHEFQSLAGSVAWAETNPMLGVRGTFSYLSDPTLFDLELAALAQVLQSGYTNVHLLLPFVRTVEEFSFCKSRAIAAGLTQYGQFQLWIMAEVPSVLFLLPDYVKAGVQGVSIGTNDLTQLLLGVDRDQAQMAPAFNERHPAVLQAIRSIIQLAKTSGIPCSICGLAASQFTEIIEVLVLAGITSISVELDAVERTYTAIARAEQRLILEAARRQLGTGDW